MISSVLKCWVVRPWTASKHHTPVLRRRLPLYSEVCLPQLQLCYYLRWQIRGGTRLSFHSVTVSYIQKVGQNKGAILPAWKVCMNGAHLWYLSLTPLLPLTTLIVGNSIIHKTVSQMPSCAAVPELLPQKSWTSWETLVRTSGFQAF